MTIFSGARQRVLLGCLAMALVSGSAHAALTITSNGFGTDSWETESGQAMPTGVVGTLNGTLNITTAGFYQITYGAPLLIGAPPATGSGDSAFTNEVYFGNARATAETAGLMFCNRPIKNHCAASAVGATFSVFLPVGPVPFHFLYNQASDGSGGVSLDNGSLLAEGIANGAILDTTGPISTSAANVSLSDIAYVGLSDQAYPADHDFQDLVFSMQVLEPATLSVLGFGLFGLAMALRRRTHAA